MKEVEIGSVVDYIKYIYSIPQSIRDTFNRDKIFKIINEISMFEEDVNRLNKEYKYWNDKNEMEEFKEEFKMHLKDRLNDIIKYYHKLPFIDNLISIQGVKSNNYYYDRIDLGHIYNELEFFYRGLYNGKKFNLLPSAFRTNNYGKEDRYYHYIKAKCTSELKERNHLDTLVTLQHYDCPTRLLDITSNPLVALYFACKNYACNKCEKADYGYVYVFANYKSKLLFKDSDRVIMLSCLARFSREEQEEMHNECIELILKNGINATFNAKRLPKLIDRLYHEIMTEVNFEKRILARDLLQNYFIQPDNSNRRIDKQSGAFIISGLSKDQDEIENKIYHNIVHKIKVINQEEILKELDILNINEASLFPELDKVSKYYVSKM